MDENQHKLMVKNLMDTWREIVKEWYPHLKQRSYFVPPVVINRMEFDLNIIAGQPVFVPLSSSLFSSSRMSSETASQASSTPVESVSNTPPVEFGQNTQPLKTDSNLNSAVASGNQHHAVAQFRPTKVQESSLLENLAQFRPTKVQESSLHEDLAQYRPSKVQKISHCEDMAQFRPTKVQESHLREDLAQQRVLFGFRELATQLKEVMFVISQLRFSDYLRNPCYVPAAKVFLRPQDLAHEYRQGDFDILIIHRYYGLLIGEIKSVKANSDCVNTLQFNIVKSLTSRIWRAVKQLYKSEKVIHELIKDIDPFLTVRKMLILPYTDVSFLKHVVTVDTKLGTELATCLGVQSAQQALEFCVTEDHFSSHSSASWDIQKLTAWWKNYVSPVKDAFMTESKYLDLIARFCGPATSITVHCVTPPRVEVRTESEGVFAVGERITLLVLTNEQVHLLTKAPPRVILTGPPGTGKSVMLTLIAVEWLRQGYDVSIMSVGCPSVAANWLVYYMVQKTVSSNSSAISAVGQVHLYNDFNFTEREIDVDRAVTALMTERCSPRHIVCDEFWTDPKCIQRLHQFVEKLCKNHPETCIWVASPYDDQIPRDLQMEPLTIPLRCPPEVLQEVQLGVSQKSTIHHYNTDIVPPCYGTTVIRLRHKGPLHRKHWPLDCFECGENIASTLEQLKVGIGYQRKSTALVSMRDDGRRTSVPPLQYRDVFVLTRCTALHDHGNNNTRCITPHSCRVVCGLRHAGMLVRVIIRDSCMYNKAVQKTALAQSDKVTLAHYEDVTGLERKIVVWLPHRIAGEDDKHTDEYLEARGRLWAMSRCTAQLVVVDVPLS